MSNKLLLTIPLVMLLSINSLAQDALEHKKPIPIPITEALDKGMLELNITGAYDPRIFWEVIDRDGVHYGKCMAIVLRSKIDSFIYPKLDCGTLLVPTDDSVQIMITTHEAQFPLYPHSTYATRFYAMCTEFHDRAPTVATTFRIGKMADSSLLKLAKYLEAAYMQNMVGQHAVWAYTDQVNFGDLKKYGADSISIIKTKEILDAVKIKTTLNKTDISPVNEKTFTLAKYYVYAGIGLIVILVVTIISLLITKKKRANINA